MNPYLIPPMRTKLTEDPSDFVQDSDMNSYLSHLECGWCGATYAADQLMNLCPNDGKPLLPRYDLDAARAGFSRDALKDRPWTLWRYAEMLPVQDAAFRFTLGEGGTPLLHLPSLGDSLGLSQLYAKDEGINPTGSFKARGLAAAVARAAELGVEAVAIPSAGNAGSAAAAYAARAGLAAYVFLPRDVPRAFLAEIEALGAEITLVDGLITDCARYVRQGVEQGRWFDLSTLKEPYRLDGKKTMGYELFEQLGRLPDAILYPTGGGTGLLGMMKAFDELQDMGIAGPDRPRMIAVQAEGCAPIVRAFEEGLDASLPIQDARTIAAGLCVPKAFADRWILREIRRSRGTAVAVSDDAILVAMLRAARRDGVLLCPEGAALVAALPLLLDRGDLARDDQVILFNTASAYKYPDAMERLAAME